MTADIVLDEPTVLDVARREIAVEEQTIAAATERLSRLRAIEELALVDLPSSVVAAAAAAAAIRDVAPPFPPDELKPKTAKKANAEPRRTSPVIPPQGSTIGLEGGGSVLTDKQLAVLNAVTALQRPCKTSEITEAVDGMSATAVKAHLRVLVDRGLVVATGVTMSRRYSRATGTPRPRTKPTPPAAAAPTSLEPTTEDLAHQGAEARKGESRRLYVAVQKMISDDPAALTEDRMAQALNASRDAIADACGRLLLEDLAVMNPDGTYSPADGGGGGRFENQDPRRGRPRDRGAGDGAAVPAPRHRVPAEHRPGARRPRPARRARRARRQLPEA